MKISAYEITKLAFADVVKYRKILSDLQEERKFRRISYESARKAITRYHSSASDTQILTTAITNARMEQNNQLSEEDLIQAKNCAEVMEVYLSKFAIPFRPIDGLVPSNFQSYQWTLKGINITGKPHFSVRNNRGKIKYIYLVTAKDWSKEEKRFYISLLGEILANNLSEFSPKDLEGLDCRIGNKILCNGLGKNYRQRVDLVIDILLNNRWGTPSNFEDEDE